MSVLRRELRSLRELPRLVWHTPALYKAPTGCSAVMVLPGFSTNDVIMAPLRRYLAARGHRVWGWDLGTNRGDVARNLPAVVAQIERRVAENRGQPITLVGWSLGGYFAREAARTHPELIDQIVTLATPVRGGRRSEDKLSQGAASMIEHPICAIYSKRDAVVDWKAAVDDLNPNVEMIEVNSSHLGIIFDPTVWLRTAELLSA